MAHCAFIRWLTRIWRRILPLQWPDILHRIHQKLRKGIKDVIDLEFDDLFERCRKLTDEKLSDLFERNEINESALFEEAVPHSAQFNSVK